MFNVHLVTNDSMTGEEATDDVVMPVVDGIHIANAYKGACLQGAPSDEAEVRLVFCHNIEATKHQAFILTAGNPGHVNTMTIVGIAYVREGK